MRSLGIRHLVPALGALPADLEADGVSGLVGSSLGIAVAQAARGHRVEVVGWRPGDGTRTGHVRGVKLRSTGGWPWARIGGLDFRVVGPLLAMASSSPLVDVLHASSEPHLLLARRGRARVLHYQTPLPDRLPRSYPGLLSLADAIVFCSGYLRDRFHRAVAFPAERTFVVHNGVHLQNFRNLDGDEERRRWGIPPEDAVVLYAGAVVPEKGLADLIEAMGRVGDGHRAHLVIAGGSSLWQLADAPGAKTRSPYELELRRAAGRLRTVTWLGVVPAARMPCLLAMADIFVCPSRWGDPFPLVVLEAMAAGRAVLAARDGGIPEAVEDGATGLLYPPGDRDALTISLRRLLDDPDLRQCMGRASRRRAAEFGWDAASRQLDLVYERLLRASACTRPAARPARQV